MEKKLKTVKVKTDPEPAPKTEFTGGDIAPGTDSKKVIFEAEYEGATIKIKKLPETEAYMYEVFDKEGKRFIGKVLSKYDDEAIHLLTRRARATIKTNPHFVWNSSKSTTKKRSASSDTAISKIRQRRFKRS